MIGRLLNNRPQLIRGNSESFHDSDMSPPLPKSNLTKRLISVNSSNPEINPCYSNEDVLSRTVLYGSSTHLTSTHLDKHNFRLLVIQDQGDITQKNNYIIMFDSTDHASFKNLKLKDNHDSKHLLDLMFGNPIYQDFNRFDHFKIHILSPLQDLKHSILITNHFYVAKKKRYAIGIVVPVGLANLANAVLSNWSTITKYLNLLKLSYIDNHILLKQPNYGDLISLFRQFTRSIRHLNSIPRLLVGLIKFEPVLRNWCFEVNNWIEIKDGGARLGSNSSISGTKFLTTLLTIINDIKSQLVSPNYKPDEMVRVVIMAANPIVAQKLIFIISGLLPFKLNFEIEQIHKTNSSVCMSSIPNELTIPENDVYNSNSEAKVTPTTPSVNSSKGWEIPKISSRSVSTASITTPTKSFVPRSSSMSTSSSMYYLSSSLSQSQSSTLSSSFSRGFQLLQNWKNSFDSTNSSSSVSSFHSMHQRTPSPGGEEYDDYPWTTSSAVNGKTTFKPINTNCSQYQQQQQHSQSLSNMNHHLNHHHLARGNSYFDLGTNHFTNNAPLKLVKRQPIPKLPHIDRNITTLYNIGGVKKSDAQLFNKTRKELSKLMSSKIKFEFEQDINKNVMMLDVAFVEGDEFDNLSPNSMIDEDETAGDLQYKHHTLPLLSGYINEFVPEFQLQACPISQDLESRIVSTMKNDLKLVNDTKTILVSLRAREIQEISLSKRNRSEYKSYVRKLYCNGKPSSTLDKESFSKINDLIERVVMKFHNETEGEEEDLKEVAGLLESL